MRESGRLPLYLETLLRAMKYEIKIQEGNNPLLKEALRLTRNGLERREAFQSIGWSEEEEQRRWIFDKRSWFMACEISRQSCIQEYDNIIKDTPYQKIKPNSVPLYLQNNMEIKLMARFRCGCEERARDRWRKEKDRLCRLCGTEEETIEHLITTCHPSEMSEEDLLGEDGKGLKWMRDLVEGRLWFEEGSE